MSCALNSKDHELAYMIAQGYLADAMKANKPLNIDSIIEEIYDSFDESEKEYALALIQSLPRHFSTSLNYTDELRKFHKTNGFTVLDIDDLRDEFEDINNILKRIKGDAISQEEIDELKSEVIQDKKKPVQTKKLSIEEIDEDTKKIENEFNAKQKTALSGTGQQLLKDTQGKPTKQKDPNQNFYYNILPFFYKAFLNGINPNELTINNHTGFKLKLVSKSKIDPNKYARKDELDFVQGKKEKTNFNPLAIYNKGVGLFLTDNNGNILYFDEKYNVVSKETDNAKPIYFSIRQTKFEDNKYLNNKGGYNLISTETLADILKISLEEAEIIQQNELKLLHELRSHVENTKDDIILDISGVSQGLLNIRYEGVTKISDIDWNASDVNLNIKVAKLNAEELGEKKGGAYIHIPGYRSIPIQANNLSLEDINKVLNLVYNNKLKNENGIILDAETKIRLAQNIILTNEKSVGFYTKPDGTIKVTLQGIEIPENEKQKIIDFLTRPYISKDGNPSSIYYTTDGQYAFTEPKDNKQFEEFQIEGDTVVITEKDFSQHIAENGLLRIIPNESANGKPIITFVNGYFQFSITEKEKRRIGLISEKPTLNEIPNSIEPNITINEPVQPEEKIKTIQRRKKRDTTIDTDDLHSVKLNSVKATPKQIAEAKEWFDKSPISKYIKYEELFNVINSNAWASFVDGGIKLYSGSNYTLLYHEAFHAFTQHFLSKEEKQKLYNEVSKTSQGKKAIEKMAKNKNININDLTTYDRYLAIEELLAEDFREYVLSDGTKVLKQSPERNSIFRRILNFLKRLFEKTLGIESTIDNTLLNVEELYNKLHIGNINNYQPSSTNAFFGNTALYSAKDGNLFLEPQEEKLILDSIDGIISTEIDKMNQKLGEGNTTFTSAVFINPEKYLTNLYDRVYNTLEDKRVEFEEQIENADSILKEELLRKARLLDYILEDQNFGEYSTKNGLIGLHLSKSPYLQEHIKDLDNEVYATTKADIAATKFDIQGNELSKIDMATDRLKFLLGSIKKLDKDGNEELNALGFPVLMTKSEVFKKLSKIIGENNGTPRIILETLQAAEKENPWLKSLIRKLGPTSSPYISSQNLWTSLWDVYYNSIQRLHSVLINESKDEDGNKTYEVLTGYAAAVFRQVERDFKSQFKTANNINPYIIDSGKIGNILDLKKVLSDFKGKLITPENKHKFLVAIGLPLSNNIKLIQEIEDSKIGVDFIYDKLEKYSLNPQTRILPITDIIAVLRNTIPIKIEKDGKLKSSTLPSESSNVNKLLSLEAKYNENYSNFSVLTSKGTVAYENNRMSTAAVMVKNINEVNNFDELRSIPEMSFLDYKNNPRVTSLSILKAIFKYDKATDTFGDKIPGAHLRFDLADGVQNIEEDSHSDKEYSTATSNADGYTRLLQDVYSMFLEGKTSAITPGDKNTITMISASNLPAGNTYINIGDFGKVTTERINLGIQNAYNILLPKINAELKEMKMIEEHQSNPTTLPNVLAYTVPDSKGKLTGVEFSAFSFFPDEFKTKLKEVYNKSGNVNSLAKEIIQELNLYFSKETIETSNTINELLYVDEKLKNLVKENSDIELNDRQINNIILKAYTVNKWIHNLEHVELFYGSPAQFKDLDKRGSALNSVGRMQRVDQDMLDFLNSQIGRPWADRNSLNSYNEFSDKANAGIFQDEKIISEYVKSGHYETELRKNLKERKYSKEKIDKTIERILKPYKEMETGDAQGWITFDSYRSMSIAENRWSDQQEALFQQIITDPKNVKIENISEYFPVRKYQYFGPLAVSGLHVTAFHKFSLLPLIPGVIDGTKLEDLHNTMMKNGIDYATYNTGSKVGTIVAPGSTKPDNIFLKDGEINTDFKITKNPVYIKYIKDQLDINSEFKRNVIFSTQLRKLIEEGLVSNGVPINFRINKSATERKKEWEEELTEEQRLENKLYSKYKNYESKIDKLIKFRTAELINEIGSTPQEFESGTADITKLITFVKKELKTQDLSEEELNFIGVDSKGQLINDLSLSPSAAQIEKLLNSIVNNRLIKQKVKGEALIQVSNNLFEPKKPTAIEQLIFGSIELRTYRVDPDTGKTLAAEVKIALQGDFTKLLELRHKDGKKVAVYTIRDKQQADGTIKKLRELNEAESLKRLNETINDPEWRNNPEHLNMITMVGVRIPVQGLNSMEFMTVKEFLPARAGNIIIPPAEIVAKSGSDFDVDKLTIMMPSIININGEIKLNKEGKSTKSEFENIERINKINETLKDLKSERVKLQKEYNEEYKKLIENKLTAEEYEQFKQDNLLYEEELNRLGSEMSEQKNIINELISYKTLSDVQIELLHESNIRFTDLYDDFNNVNQEKYEKSKKYKFDQLEKSLGEPIKSLNKEIGKLTLEKSGLSGQAIENGILSNIIDILELPENFINLITPNDTSLVKGLADKLAKDRKYKEPNNLSKYFSPAYNIYKHESNSVGKETLGLGAIDNTYNTIFNRIGAYMNPTYFTDEKGNNLRRATILLDHNELNGGISLSHAYDANNDIRISDIINQLMNGWVDVAKDAWIFDIQGNKQVSPVLLFMIQAGVPFEQAVYFLSNPIIKEYVNQQKIALSPFSKALGKNAPSASVYKNKAKVEMFKKLSLKHLIKTSHKGESINQKKLYEHTLEKTQGLNFSLLVNKIYKRETFDRAMYDKNARAGFLHYLELESLAAQVTDLKSKLNYDTSRSNSLFEAAKNEADLEVLRNSKLFPQEVVDSILKESPIGSFRVAPLQLKLWGGLFKIRNNENLNDYLVELLKDQTSIKKMKKIYGSTEKYIENFKNDLIVKIFTNSIRQFNPTSYKGLNTDYTSNITKVKGLKRGVAVVPDSSGKMTVYIDEEILNKQIENNLFESTDLKDPSSYKNLGLVTVPIKAFMSITDKGLAFNKDEYYKFSIEREYQRALNPFSKLSKTEYFKYKYEKNLIKFKDKLLEASVDEKERRILQFTYEEILRNKALNNILNTWKLFKSDSTISDELNEIKEMHPYLADKYNIIRDLVANSLEQVRKNKEGEFEILDIIKNITLRDNRLPSEDMNIYQNNMKQLSNPDVNSITVTEENLEQDLEENKRISQFFSNLPLVGFLQSGLNTKDSVSIMKAMPTSKIIEIINYSLSEYNKIMSDKYKSDSFLNNYKKEFNFQNSSKRITLRKRIKEYNKLNSNTIPNIILNKEEIDVEPDHIIAMQFEDEFQKTVQGINKKTVRTKEYGIKKGDVIEFVKSFPDHTESLFVVATSDEEIIPTVSSTNQVEFTNHSGGAIGSDTEWDIIGSEFGMVNNKHYWTETKTPKGNTEISKQDFEEGRFESAKAAKRNFGYQYSAMKDSRLIRNWSQVKHSESVFAIGSIVGVGEKLFPNQKLDTRTAINPSVTGGTGYAVGMAINNNKPVYVFNQTKGSYDIGWYKYDKNINDFIKVETPVLTKNFAGIGTREINENGKQAIRDVYEKTTSTQPTSQQKQQVLGSKQDIEGFKDFVTQPTLVESTKPIVKIEFSFDILGEVQNDLNLSNEQNKLKTISNFTELTGTSEYELKVPINELEEVRNRLKCNL